MQTLLARHFGDVVERVRRTCVIQEVGSLLLILLDLEDTLDFHINSCDRLPQGAHIVTDNQSNAIARKETTDMPQILLACIA